MARAMVHAAPAVRPLSARRVVGRLLKVYGPSRVPRRLDPLAELILTILSQSTSDRNSRPAYETLLERFDDWDALRKARVGGIAKAIRRAGLANQKAPRIKQLLQRLHREHGATTLDHLEAMTDDEARAYLASFEGVGPKTAACVLLFACGRPVLPVDTHVHRLSKRLQLIDSKTTAAAAHDLLQRQLRDSEVLDFHVLLIKHGRSVCKAISPHCRDCVLLDRCAAGQKNLAERRLTERAIRAPRARGKASPKAATPHVPPAKARRKK